jgi:hypothetical protein
MSTLRTLSDLPASSDAAPSRRPYRTNARTTQSEVATIKGATFDAVARALELIGRVRADDPRLRGWIQHTDERVPLALLGDQLAPWLATSPEHALLFYWRAVRDAEREQALWTPLLDRLAAAGVWPTEGGAIVVAGQTHLVAPRTVDEFLAPLAAWCERSADADAFDALDAAFHAPQVRALVASARMVAPECAPDGGAPEAGAPDFGAPECGALEPEPAVVSATVPTPIASALAHVAAVPGSVDAATNHATPAPDSGCAPDAVSAAFAALQVVAPAAAPARPVASETTVSIEATREPHADAPPRRAGSRDDVPSPEEVEDYRALVTDAIASLVARGGSWTPGDVSVLLDVADLAAGCTDERAVPPDARAAVEALLNYRQLATDALNRLYGACRRIKAWVVRIVSHASATIELWRNALRDNNWLDVREAICANRLARRDAVIRRILSRSSSTKVLSALCLDGDADDIAQLIRRLAPQDPWALLRALTEAVRTTGLRLAAGDLSPLLGSNDQSLQGETLRLLQMMVRPA